MNEEWNRLTKKQRAGVRHALRRLATDLRDSRRNPAWTRAYRAELQAREEALRVAARALAEHSPPERP